MLAQMIDQPNDFMLVMQFLGPAVALVLILAGIIVPRYKTAERRTEQPSWETNKIHDELHRQVQSLQSAPLPGVPTICLLDHRHSSKCLGPPPLSPTPLPNPYIPFDPDLYDVELIEPVLVADDLKWKKVA